MTTTTTKKKKRMEGKVETKEATKKELSSHLSELRIEGSSITAVDFSDPCSVCGNKKRRCLQPPTSFRKKVLIVEDDTDAQTDHNSFNIDDEDERNADFPTTPRKTKEGEEKRNGGCCSFCQRCSTTATASSRDGLSQSSSFIMEEKGGSFLAGVSSPFLERTSSVVTEDKGRNFAGGGQSPFLARANSLTTNDEKRGSISGCGGSGYLLRTSRTSSVVTTEEKGGTFSSRGDGGLSPFNARTNNSLPVSPQLGRNGSVHSSISPLLTMSNGNLSSILSPEIRRKSSTGPTGHLLSPVVVTEKKSKVHFSHDASPSAAVVTVAETKKESVQRTPNSGGRSAEKVKVSLKCQCGVRHKIIF